MTRYKFIVEKIKVDEKVIRAHRMRTSNVIFFFDDDDDGAHFIHILDPS